eukprot:gene10965-biopygen12368
MFKKEVARDCAQRGQKGLPASCPHSTRGHRTLGGLLCTRLRAQLDHSPCCSPWGRIPRLPAPSGIQKNRKVFFSFSNFKERKGERKGETGAGAEGAPAPKAPQAPASRETRKGRIRRGSARGNARRGRKGEAQGKKRTGKQQGGLQGE